MASPSSPMTVRDGLLGPMRRWREEYPEAATVGELHEFDPELARDVLAFYAVIATEVREADNDSPVR